MPIPHVAKEMHPEELRKFRRKKRESQGYFWSRFGVTQSRGSRFEKGAEIPRPVAILLELYFSGVLTDGDLGGGSGNAVAALATSVPAPTSGHEFREMPEYPGMGILTSTQRHQLQAIKNLP